MKSVQDLENLTIGGFKNTKNLAKDQLFLEYIKKALPSKPVSEVKVISSPASLNSVAASGMIDGNKYFFKVHIESGQNTEEEYKQAGLLAESGWPVYQPVMQSENSNFPLLVYPWNDNPTLFDELEQSYKTGQAVLGGNKLKILEDMNRSIGQAEASTLKEISAAQATKAPIQMFFARRFEAGGRIDYWYEPKTMFALPAANGKRLNLNWDQVKNARWTINDRQFTPTFSDIIEEARKVLVFSGEDRAWAVTSHGDDHAGNIFLSESQAKVFDPAAASDANPAILSDAKALAHSGFLPMAGMYYDPKLSYCYSYIEEENTIKVDVDFSRCPVFDTHMLIARQIINLRIKPLLSALSQKNANLDLEVRRFKTAMAGCALLTVNIAQLLKAGGGRGAGLLPMAILLYELAGFEILKEAEIL